MNITIKKKTPILKKHVTLKQNTKLIYFTLDQIIEMMNKNLDKKITLTTIIEEPCIDLDPICIDVGKKHKIDYHLQILHFIHSYDYSDKHFSLSWPLNNQCVFTFIRHYNFDQWYYKSLDNTIIVYNVQQFIDDNINNFKVYLENDKLIKDLIKQLQPILGQYYTSFIDIRWCLSIDNDVKVKIVIDRFNINNIKVTFKNKTTVHNNITLITFINKNLDKINIFKQEIDKYNSNQQILNNEKIHQEKNQLKIEKDLRNLHLDEKIKEYNNTIKQKKMLVLLYKNQKNIE